MLMHDSLIPAPCRAASGRVARWLRLIVLAVAGMFVLAGCGQEKPGAVELVLKQGKLFGDPAGMQQLLSQFERDNPGIRVRTETLPASSDEQHQFYVINLQAGAADFDVMAIDVIWVGEFARAGWLRELDALLPEAEREDFFSGPIEAVTYQGKRYAVPWFIDAGLLYYRSDLLEEAGLKPPTTWDEMRQAVLKVRASHPAIQGYVWQGKQYEGLVCNVLEVLWSNGGAVLEGGRVVLDSAQNAAALEAMRRFVAGDGISPDWVTTLTEEPAREVFSRGEAVFLRNWPYAWNVFQQQDSAVRGKVGVSVLPHFAGGRSAATLGGWQLGVNANSKHPEAAARLVRFLTSAASQKRIALDYGYSPPRRSLYADADLRARQPLIASLADVFEHARPRPVTPDYVAISQVLQAQFSAALTGARPPAEALRAAQAEITRVVGK